MNNIQTALTNLYGHLLTNGYIKNSDVDSRTSDEILAIHLDMAAGINNSGWTIAGIRSVVLGDILLQSKDFVLKYQNVNNIGISDQDAKTVLAFLDKYEEEEFLVEEAIQKLLEQHSITLISDTKLWRWIEEVLADFDNKDFCLEYRHETGLNKVFAPCFTPLEKDDRKIIYIPATEMSPHYIYCEDLK